MSRIPEYTPRYTVEDYRLWEGDWELWNGAAVAMTPSPFGKHGNALARIASALISAIDEADCDASVLLEIDWIVSRDTVVRPDLTIVCGAPPEGHIESPPALAVEVFSESTRERDATVKRSLYEQQGVSWYLMIDPDKKQTNVFRLGVGSRFEAVDAGNPLTVDICDDCVLDVRLDRLFDRR